MRALLIITPALLTSCGQVVTQHEILQRSRAEVARREPWTQNAVILVEQRPEDLRFTWKVKAGAIDYSNYPSFHGIRFIPGTERELRFTGDGCLIGYGDRTSRCPSPYGSAMVTEEATLLPAK